MKQKEFAESCNGMSSAATTAIYKDTGRFGKIMDVIAPDGRGLHYDSNRKFFGLLEPSKP